MPSVRLPWWYRVAARGRGVAGLAGPTLILAGWLLSVAADPPSAVVLVLCGLGFLLILAGLAATLTPGAPPLPPRMIEPPVRGRWIALNSPANRRPSHGTHGQGQAFALDLIYDPEGGDRPRFGSGPGFRAPQDFPGFGQPLYAPADATVLRVRDSARDHRSRSSWGAYAFMLLDGMVRELGGTRFLLANHLVLDLGDGVYAVLAHLQHGSAAVGAGHRVQAGDVVARCGNSGNTSEPHVHLQLMDHPRPQVAAGLPFTFPGGLPRNQEPVAPAEGGRLSAPDPR